MLGGTPRRLSGRGQPSPFLPTASDLPICTKRRFRRCTDLKIGTATAPERDLFHHKKFSPTASHFMVSDARSSSDTHRSDRPPQNIGGFLAVDVATGL